MKTVSLTSLFQMRRAEARATERSDGRLVDGATCDEVIESEGAAAAAGRTVS